MGRLQVDLLGAPRLEHDGSPVTFDTRKAVALIALLAVTGRPWAREELAAVLWPETDAARSRGSLRRTLVSAGRVGEALVPGRQQIELRHELVDCDVVRFRGLVTKPSSARDREAADLCRGDFLSGFTLRDSPDFEDWSDGLRTALRRELDAALARLAEHELTKGRLDRALQDAQRRVTLDPIHEPAHRQLMRVLASAGQRPAALQQYRRCVRSLDEELGVAPLPETTALYEAIRRNSYPPQTSPPPSPPAEDAPPRQMPQLPFVGRDDESAVLRSAHAAARTRPRVVAVTGEAGTGKTRLAMQVLSELPDDTVVAVKGHQSERGLAYGAAGDLVRSAAASADVTALDPGDRSRLAALWPGLSGDDPAPLDTPGAVMRLYESVRSLVSAAAPPTPRVIWLDDVQWFDEASLDLVAFLLLRPPTGTVFVVSWRTSYPPAPVLDAVGEALRTGVGQVLTLGSLGRDDVAEILSAAGAPVAPGDLDEVMVRTGGIPLLVVEHALAAGGDAPSPTGTRDVDALVGARVDAAPDTTRQLLSALAVLGAPADALLLQQVSGRTDAEVADALEDAVQRRLLTADPEQVRYDVPHESLRDSVLARTHVARRRLLHSRAADALGQRHERRPESVPAAVVARQLELAGRTDEAAEAFVTAAAEARALYAHRTAADHLERALALGADPVAVHLALGQARVHLGDYAAAIEDFETVAARAPDRWSAVEAEHRLAEVHHRLGEWSLALDHLQAASALLEDDPADARQARVVADAALLHLRLEDVAAATTSATRARELAAEHDDLAAQVQAANVLAVLAWRADEVVTARGLLDAAEAGAEQLDDPGPLVAVLNNRARLEAGVGDLDTAVTLSRQALELGVRHGDRHRLAALHANLADLLHRSGDEDGARENQVASARLFAEVDRDSDRRPEVWKLVEW